MSGKRAKRARIEQRRAEQAAAEQGQRRGRKGLLLGGSLLAVALAAVAAVVIAKNQSQSSPVERGALPAQPAASTAREKAAPRASPFAVGTIEGGRFALAAQRGKVVVVDFLAPG